MKIGLFGVSRCGKDYLINKVLKSAINLKHIRGSTTLEKFAKIKFNLPFAALNNDEKTALRITFTEEAKKEESRVGNIIVDGHYSFPNENGDYDIVFTDADRTLYDVFIYMNTEASAVLKNQLRPNYMRKVHQYSEDEIVAWQEFEIDQMRKICKSLGTELLVIDGDKDCEAEFIAELIYSPKNFQPRALAKKAISGHRSLLECAKTVVITDCDRTLAINDTTLSFCDIVGINTQVIRENFRGEYYSIFQFYQVNKYYSDILPDAHYYNACDYAAETAMMNELLISDIKSSAGEFITLAITSGILDIWKRIQGIQHFADIVIGKGRANDGGIYVSTQVKQAIVEELKAMGKMVIAIGDSPIDIGMLEAADKGYLIAMQKLSSGVKSYLTGTPDTKIMQLKYSSFKYDKITEAESIWQ